MLAHDPPTGASRMVQRAVRYVMTMPDGVAVAEHDANPATLTRDGRALVECTMTALLCGPDARLGGVDERAGRRRAEAALVLATSLAEP